MGRWRRWPRPIATAPSGWATGWAGGTFEPPYGHAYFKEGHDDGWQNHSVVIADRRVGLLLLGNSSNADKIFKALLEQLLGDRATPWQWENYVPYQYAKK